MTLTRRPAVSYQKGAGGAAGADGREQGGGGLQWQTVLDPGSILRDIRIASKATGLQLGECEISLFYVNKSGR